MARWQVRVAVKRALMAAPALAATVLAATMTTAQPVADEGSKLYQRRCAVCHLPTGAGVPGSFPPLGKDIPRLAGQPDGRRYLVLVLVKGLSGPIAVEGKTYRGVMPAQSGLSDEEIASVLNYVVGVIASAASSEQSFTASEVASHRQSGATSTPAQMMQLNAELKRK